MRICVKILLLGLTLLSLSLANASALFYGTDRTWKVYGPDRSGVYGGAQGIGGLDNEVDEAGSFDHVPINNYFGDAIGETYVDILGTGVYASNNYAYVSALGGYGYEPGSNYYEMTPQWRGHYVDWTGLIYMGARYYEPQSGRFLSADPLGHDASMDLYSYCSGDPVNGLDPDGRDAATSLAFGSMINNMNDEQFKGYVQGSQMAAPYVAGGLVVGAVILGGPPAWAGAGITEGTVGTTMVTGAVAFGGGNIAYQDTRIGMGLQQQVNYTQFGVSTVGGTIALGGGLYIGGLYEGGVFGTGVSGVSLYAGANITYNAIAGGGLNLTEQELEGKPINWGNVGTSTILGAGAGLLSTGIGVSNVYLNDQVAELGNEAGSMNTVRDVGVYSQVELDQANNAADQAALNSNYLTPMLEQTDNYITPSVQSSLESIFEPGQEKSESDPLSSQKLNWKN